MNLGFSTPWLLALAPLALLPLLARGQAPLAFSSLSLLPPDRLSGVLALLLRLAAAAAVVAIVLGLSGPFRPPQTIERIGQGAQMVLLLDRSSSMDQTFAGRAGVSAVAAHGFESKGQVARRLLAEFAARRNQDLFGMLVFSTHPIQVLPLTDKPAMVQAAIAAGNSGRGLAKTNLGAGLVRALEFFADKPYNGSRLVLLVSDGGARLSSEAEERIRSLMQRYRVALYWIYIRSQHSPGLEAKLAASSAQEIAPEQLLHRFFETLAMPYRAYSAENPAALAQAIDDVSRLQSLPIRYQDVVPRSDLAGWCYGAGLFFILPLVLAKLVEVRTWGTRGG